MNNHLNPLFRTILNNQLSKPLKYIDELLILIKDEIDNGEYYFNNKEFDINEITYRVNGKIIIDSTYDESVNYHMVNSVKCSFSNIDFLTDNYTVSINTFELSTLENEIERLLK